MVYTAYKTVGVVKQFTCGGCKFSSKVEVTARGAGQVTGSAGGAQVARTDAAVAAERWAEIFLQLCPCPKCGWRDPVHAGKYKKRFFIVGGVSVGLLALGGALIPLGIPFGGGILAFFGLLGAIIAPAMGFSTWSGARKNVKFLHEAPASDGGAIG